MTERLLLVSTCGTSLFTNGADPEDRSWLTKVANDLAVEEARLQPIVADRRARLTAGDGATRRQMSAELGGVAAVMDRFAPQQVFHLLVHTDTALGSAAAKLVQEVLGGSASLVSASGLRTNDLASLRSAIADLTRSLDENVESYRSQGWPHHRWFPNAVCRCGPKFARSGGGIELVHPAAGS